MIQKCSSGYLTLGQINSLCSDCCLQMADTWYEPLGQIRSQLQHSQSRVT